MLRHEQRIEKTVSAATIERRPFHAIIHAANLHRDEPKADTTLPRLFQQPIQNWIDFALQIGRLIEAFASSAFIEVVVTDSNFDRAYRLAFAADLGKEPVGNASQLGKNPVFIRYILLEGFLLAVGFRGGRLADDRALVDPVRKFPQLPRPLSSKKG